MASLGDSITRAYNACGFFSDCPTRSWATGTDSAVNSHYRRLREGNDALVAYNDARSGARAAELASQAEVAVSQDVDYVTILIGANDACARSEPEMTPVDGFEEQIRAALETLDEDLPDATLVVASIPDLKRLWLVGKDRPEARRAWDAFDICQSMLANPTSADPADEARRDRVRQRVIDYNAVLEEACRDHSRCRFDDDVFSYEFTLDRLSSWDYFHPNTSGQSVLADLTYEAVRTGN
jgi:lysophospholipase L1-like esterase